MKKDWILYFIKEYILGGDKVGNSVVKILRIAKSNDTVNQLLVHTESHQGRCFKVIDKSNSAH